MMDDRQFFEWIKKGVDLITDNGEVPVPVAFGMTNRPNVAASIPSYDTQDEKVNAFTAVFAVLRGMGATNLGIVLDAYYLSLSPEEAPEGVDLSTLPLPSASPERKEAIIAYSTEHFGMKRYDRNDDGTIEWHDWDDQGAAEGWISEKMAQVLALPDPTDEERGLIQDLMRAYDISVFPIG